mmetsp:Transcript_17296/g.25640  ORF Transcript_17296/g.25640 Transcript_17296/m.25640 type:complete len:201 (+) Transcript_17296:35-637(+)
MSEQEKPSVILAILAAVTLSSICSIGPEILSRYFFYLSDEYLKCEKAYNRLDKDIERRKSEMLYQTDLKRRKKEDKVIEQLTKEMDENARALQAFKMKAGFIGTMFLFFGYWVFSKNYRGLILSTLPFQVPIILRMFTHRGLPGEDYSQISVSFVFFITTMVLRRMVERNYGTPLPKSLKERTSFSNQMKEMERKASKAE